MAKNQKPARSTPAQRKERGLKKLATLLTELRSFGALREASPGIFRWKSRAFLHFHYFPDGTLIADARIHGDDFQKFDVTTPTGQAEFLTAICKAIGE